MARRYTDYFFDSDPPKQEPTQQITLEQPANETVQAQPQEVSPVSQEPSAEMTDSAKEALRLTPGSPAFVPQPTEAAPAPEAPAANVPQQPAETQPETTTTEQPAESIIPGAPKYKTVEQIREEYSKGYSPMKSLLQSQNPVLDAKRQERLQRIAAINSVGKGLGTILQGYYGKKGATITPDKNELLPEAYKEYMSNIDEYEKKKDIWNKDMLALSLKEQGDVDAAVKQQENNQRADAIAAWQQNNQKLRDEATMKFQKEMNSINQEFQERMAKARSADELKALQIRIKAQRDEATTNFDRQMEMLERQIEAGKYNRAASATGGTVARPAGAEAAPLYFRGGASGQRIFLDADQLEVVPDLLQKAAGDLTDTKYLMNKKIYEKFLAGGKLTEAEAQYILSSYGEKYYDFTNGKAVPKGQATAQPAQQTVSTGGAY